MPHLRVAGHSGPALLKKVGHDHQLGKTLSAFTVALAGHPRAGNQSRCPGTALKWGGMSAAMCSYAAAFERNRRLPWVAGPSVGPAMSMEVCTRGTGAFSLPLRTRPGEGRWGGHGSPWRCASIFGGAVLLPAASRTVLEHGGGQTVVVQNLECSWLMWIQVAERCVPDENVLCG